MNIELRGVPIVFFEEGEVIIAHCVPLDVSSCGHNLEEARRNIRDAVAGFLEACEEMGTLVEVLEESGFVKQGEAWIPPALLNTDQLDISA
ncbi:MAG TPA: type II toxin-antitoxin system HicB family antitoxin [Blastocatellia bacterium]|nr:type II toxin-antitoxin system HicB family antitoxin [Blastocatellia bacterium]